MGCIMVSVSSNARAIRRSIMTAAVKKSGKHFVRWFRKFQDKNRPPYRWYEHSYYDA